MVQCCLIVRLCTLSQAGGYQRTYNIPDSGEDDDEGAEQALEKGKAETEVEQVSM